MAEQEATLPEGATTEQMVRIDGKDYALSSLSDDARAQVNSLRFIEGEIARLNASLAMANTARNAYLRAKVHLDRIAAVALSALVLFPVEPFAAMVMISAAALPVAGNVYILAQHYNVAPQRVSAAILVSTAVSIVTVSVVIGWLQGLEGL